ncbi:MAG: hypothetical protein LBD09_04445, partial [Treponema sp.]|nr:hypothetical protein [Treponema sp.]
KIVLGKKAVARLYRRQIAARLSRTAPNLAGEFGLPFDLFKGRAFKTGDYRIHEEALDGYYAALDEFLVGAAIWDYSADNTHRWGDRWNNEDFSIVTTGDGGPLRPRAAGGWMRPYPLATAGTPLSFRWDRKKRRLVYRYFADPAVAAPTAIFIPAADESEPSPSALGRAWPEAEPLVTIQTAGKNAAAPFRGIRTEYVPERRELYVYHGDYGGELEITVLLPGGSHSRKRRGDGP